MKMVALRAEVASVVVVLVLAVSAGCSMGWPDAPCRYPPGARRFSLEKYSGTWYEIGKIQTAGGAFFEKNCVCTQLDIQPTSNRTGYAANICRFKTVTGRTIVANGTLTNTNATDPARFVESFLPFSKVAYNVIYLDDNFSIEYDCGEEAGFTNYCFHVLARKPEVPDEDVKQLLQLADRFDLNPKNISYKKTKQTGCWDH